jgi:AcrR family transcriptional regulator
MHDHHHQTPPEGRLDEILRVSAELFRAKGYHASSVRDIAKRVQVQPASIYYYFESKQSILVAIMEDAICRLLAGAEEARGENEHPVEQLRGALRQHVLLHATRPVEAMITDTEYQAVFEEIIAEGVARSVFNVSDQKLAVYSVLEMCTAVCFWFKPDGRLTAERVADEITTLALRVVGYFDPDACPTDSAPLRVPP